MDVRINHPTDRPNFTIVTVGDVQLAFSYKTIVGFNAIDGRGWVVSENLWGNTTGKHLNYLDDRGANFRVPREEFEAKLEEVLS